ncbi:RDD family protein [Wenyingzhuangia sp. IMCC45574]
MLKNLSLCKSCTNHKATLEQGIICGLTLKKPNYDNTCNDYNEDSVLKAKNDLLELDNLYEEASKSKRFANYLIDLVFKLIIAAILGLILGLLAPSFILSMEGNKIFDYVTGFIITFIYYSVFEFYTGKTLGKIITKTKVLTEENEKPSLNTILARSAYRIVPFDAFSFLGSEGGWHDRWSKTKVVLEKED